MPEILTAAGLAVAFPLAALGLGLALLRRVGALDATERLAAGFALGLALLAAARFLAVATGLADGVVLAAAGLGALALGLAPAAARPAGAPDPGLAPLLLLGYLQLLLIQAALPLYAGGNWYFDWWLHYATALAFLGDGAAADPAILAARNPLFNLAMAAPMALAGPGFWLFQAAAAAPGAALLLAFHLLLRDLFGAGIARLGLGLASLNIWLMHLIWFPWSKALVAAFLLLALHWHLRWLRRAPADRAGRRADIGGVWLMSCLAFLTHQLAAPYVAALLVHGLAVAWRGGLPGLSRAAGFAAATLVLLGPWYLWLLATVGLPGVLRASPLAVMQAEAATQGALLHAMAQNALNSLLPTFIDLPHGPLHWLDLQRWLVRISFNQLVGVLTATQLVCLLLLGRQRLLASPSPSPGPSPGPAAAPAPAGPDPACARALACFGLLGALLSLPLHPRIDPYGLLPANLFPAALVLLAGSIGLIAGRGGGGVRRLLVAGSLAEYLLLFWSYLPAIPRLDPIPANAALKADQGLVFLAELTGPARPLVLAALLLVQLALGGLTAQAGRRPGAWPKPPPA